MLCRKKLVLFLTLTCLGLLYISANHYLSNSDSEQTNNEQQSSLNSHGVAFLTKLTRYFSCAHCKYLQPIYIHLLCYISSCNLEVIITANGSAYEAL